MSLPDESQLIDDIAHARGRTASLRQLAGLYGLGGPGRVRLRRLLNDLVSRGRLVRRRGRQRYGIPERRQVLEAVLSGTSRGFAFAVPEEPDSPDVLIPQRHLGGALDGDRVEVRLLAGTDPARPAGEVVTILERGRAVLVGQLGPLSRGRHALLPFDPRVAADVVIPERFLHGAAEGDFVEVALLRDSRDGDQGRGSLRARVRAVLGRMDEPGTDVRVIVASYGLADRHSAEAEAEAERRAQSLKVSSVPPGRTDLRALATVTIDGETARDFDDAVSLERLGAGYRLRVHVADVAEHVEEGTRLDAEAYARATSVYFPDRAIHMLPEVLAAGACSLRPDEDRLAMTVTVDLDREGRPSRFAACESVIRSDRRMTYTEIRRLLVDGDEGLRRDHADFMPLFELMAELADLLIARREERGGLDFDLPVPIVQLDEKGLVQDIVSSERNAAHRIIEEFMIVANEAVARMLDDASEPTIHRNHVRPPEDKVQAFREAAAAFGHVLGDPGSEEPPTPLDFRRVLDRASGRPEEHLLTALALRTMAQARYGAELEGHFGLALTHYLHFTSPIRRYPDIVAHRALKRLLRDERTAAEDADEVRAVLAEDAEHCSKRERIAEEAERALVRWKACRFMSERIGSEHAARVSGPSDRFLHVLLDDPPVEGRIPVSALTDDHYDRDESGFRLVGRRTGRVFRPGDSLRVRVRAVDLLRRHVVLEPA